MRLRPALQVSDAARRMIARIRPDGRRTVRGALATRTVVIAYLQERLNQLSALTPWWDDEPLTPEEIADARGAVETLRSAGKSEPEIRAWLLLQRARYDLRRIGNYDQPKHQRAARQANVL
jgi:hypothetical protein